MRTLLIYLSLMLLIAFDSIAYSSDSLVSFNDLSFKDNLERSAFLNFETEKTEMALLQLCLTSFEQLSLENSNKIHFTIDNFVKKLSKKGNSTNEEKSIQNLREAVINKFLKVYKINSNFSELFETGSYDCITATSLYAILLFKLNIPYQIKEERNRIYIIAYPQSKKILIENIDTDQKYAIFQEHFTGKYVKSLFYENKIPLEEFEKINKETLFENYYFKSEELSLLQLASIKFNINSMIAVDEKKFQVAINEGLKSYFLDACMRNQVALKYHIFNALGSNGYMDKFDVDKLVFICRLNNQKDKEVNNEFIISEYKTLLNSVLIKNNDQDSFEKYHNLIILNINDNLLKQEIEFKYHLEIARINLNKWNEKKLELYHIKSAFNIKPGDKEIKSIISEALNIKLNETEDPEIVLQLIDDFMLAFQFLQTSQSALRIKAHCYLDLAYKNIINGNIKIGEQFLVKNEDLCKKNTIVLEENIVEKGYMSAAKYHFNSGNKIKAKEYLAKGLELAPQSIKIKDKLKMVN